MFVSLHPERYGTRLRYKANAAKLFAALCPQDGTTVAGDDSQDRNQDQKQRHPQLPLAEQQTDQDARKYSRTLGRQEPPRYPASNPARP